MPDSHREEIAKLETLYANNPEGRVFTHLAEAYRRAGDLDRAREILDDGLTRHSEYASAHVVLGRVLTDRGDNAAAAASFRRVLELDRQNLVALRSLGELAAQESRPGEALTHYRELLSLDPGDDRLRMTVARLEERVASGEADAPLEEAAAAPVDEAFEALPVSPDPVSPEPDAESEQAFEWLPGFTTNAPDWETRAGDAEPALPGDLASLGEDVPDEALETASADAPPEIDLGFPSLVEPTGPAAEEPEGEAARGDAEWLSVSEWARVTGSAGATGPAAPTGEPPDDGAEEMLQPLDPWDLSAAADAPEPAADDLGTWPDLGSPGAAGSTGTGPIAEDDRPAESDPFDTGSFSKAGLFEAGGPAAGSAPVSEPWDDVEEREVWSPVEDAFAGAVPPDPEMLSADADAIDEAMATETLAELYSAQGLHARAAEVYGALLRRHPADERLRQRLDQATAAVARSAAPPAPEEHAEAEGSDAWLENVEAAWTGGHGVAGAAPTPYAWKESAPDETAAGPPIGDYFRALLAWRPGGAPAEAEPPPAEATVAEPVDAAAGIELDEIELDEIELDEFELEDVAPEETELAGPAPWEPEAEGAAELLLEEEDAVGVEDAAPAPDVAVIEHDEEDADRWMAMPADEAGEGTAERPPAASAEEDEDDLEMFRSWLQSLRK